MPTPIKGYRNAKGEKIPSVTSVLGRFKDPGALMYWSWGIGAQAGDAMRGLVNKLIADLAAAGGLDKAELVRRLQEVRNIDTVHYRDVSAKACTIGTLCHARVEAWLKGKEFSGDGYDPAMVEESLTPFGAFLRWVEQSKLRVTSLEVPLVSEEYQFGGTPDAVEIEGAGAILDWKTSGGVYAEALLQCAAYLKLWNEAYPYAPLTGGVHIVRFAKETGDFAHHHFPNLDDAWEAFLHLRKAYDLVKSTEKRIK